VGGVVAPVAVDVGGGERAARVSVLEVVAELGEPTPVALAGAEVLRLVAADPLPPLDGEQPDHRPQRQRRGDQPVEPARGERPAPHRRASAAKAKKRSYGFAESSSRRTGAT